MTKMKENNNSKSEIYTKPQTHMCWWEWKWIKQCWKTAW